MAQLFPLGLENNYDLQNIMNSDSLTSLGNLPSFNTSSKAYSIDSLAQFDIDENIITKINSRYIYTIQQMNSNIQNTSIHSTLFTLNLNGLESKFEEYHNFFIILKWTSVKPL